MSDISNSAIRFHQYKVALFCQDSSPGHSHLHPYSAALSTLPWLRRCRQLTAPTVKFHSTTRPLSSNISTIHTPLVLVGLFQAIPPQIHPLHQLHLPLCLRTLVSRRSNFQLPAKSSDVLVASWEISTQTSSRRSALKTCFIHFLPRENGSWRHFYLELDSPCALLMSFCRWIW